MQLSFVVGDIVCVFFPVDFIHDTQCTERPKSLKYSGLKLELEEFCKNKHNPYQDLSKVHKRKKTSWVSFGVCWKNNCLGWTCKKLRLKMIHLRGKGKPNGLIDKWPQSIIHNPWHSNETGVRQSTRTLVQYIEWINTSIILYLPS